MPRRKTKGNWVDFLSSVKRAGVELFSATNTIRLFKANK
jgi:hypothetical protein